jgi:hypothetical protein
MLIPVKVFAVVRAELMVLEVIPESVPRLVVCVVGRSEVGGAKTPSKHGMAASMASVSICETEATESDDPVISFENSLDSRGNGFALDEEIGGEWRYEG